MKTKMFFASVIFLLVLTACSTASAPTPIPTSIPFDTNSDGKITLEELRVTVETMRKLVGAIEAEKPELAAKLSAEISVYEEALTNPILLDIRSMQLTANELLIAIDEINKSR
jgi:propanediol dehydratase small subunit